MFGHLLTSWHLNIWKDKIWLSQELKELSKWSKNNFSLFHKCSLWLTKQTNTNIEDKTFRRTLQPNFRWKKVLKKEALIDYSLSCICNVSVMEFWTKFNIWYASLIPDVAIKWSQIWAFFFDLSQNPIWNQEIFSVLLLPCPSCES